MSYEFRTRYMRLIPLAARVRFHKLLERRALAQGVGLLKAQQLAADVVRHVSQRFERETTWNRVRLRKFAVNTANAMLYANRPAPACACCCCCCKHQDRHRTCK